MVAAVWVPSLSGVPQPTDLGARGPPGGTPRASLRPAASRVAFGEPHESLIHRVLVHCHHLVIDLFKALFDTLSTFIGS